MFLTFVQSLTSRLNQISAFPKQAAKSPLSHFPAKCCFPDYPGEQSTGSEGIVYISGSACFTQQST